MEQLLDAHGRAAGFLLEAPSGVTKAPAAFDQRSVEGPREQIGPYKLLQQLGEGGMGTVFLARQDTPVKRHVAIKIVKAGMDTRQVIARFEQERQALALMDHPHIAKVLDAGTTSTGRPFFVMELVRGIPITQYCDQEHLTPKQRLELFLPVCQAVQHAHQKGIIHRDLKPSNVLVALYDGHPIPKVIDFGVAKATHQNLTERTMFTEVGSIVGTLEYMAPEQAELNNLDIDTRADIYSLGVLLYELLAGSPPFTAQQLRAAAFTEMMRMIREVEPPKPSTRLSSSDQLPSIAANRQLEPKHLTTLVSGELDWIVMRCLEKERSRRYETANALAMELRRYLADEPVLAGPPSAVYRFHKFARRNRAALTTAAAFALFLLAGITISTWLAVRATHAEAEARRERDEAASAREQAVAINQFLTQDLLGQAAPEQNARDKKVTVEEILAKAAKSIDQNPRIAEQPLVEANIRQAIGNTYFKLGVLPEAEDQLRRALNLRKTALGPDHLETLAAQEDLAWFLIGGVRNFDEGEALSRQTWEARKKQLGPAHRDTLNSMDTYATALVHQRKMDLAERLARECYETRERVLGPDDRDTLTSLNNLATIDQEIGRLAKSEQLLRECLLRKRRVYPADHPDNLSTLSNLGLTLLLHGASGRGRRVPRGGTHDCASRLRDRPHSHPAFPARVGPRAGRPRPLGRGRTAAPGNGRSPTARHSRS